MTNSRRTSRGPVPGRGPAVEKHCTSRSRSDCPLRQCHTPDEHNPRNKLLIWMQDSLLWGMGPSLSGRCQDGYSLLKFQIDSAPFFSPRSLIYAEYNLRFYHPFPSFAHPHKTLINFLLHQTHNRRPSHPDAILLFHRPDLTSEHIQIAANITELYSNILPGWLKA